MDNRLRAKQSELLENGRLVERIHESWLSSGSYDGGSARGTTNQSENFVSASHKGWDQYFTDYPACACNDDPHSRRPST